MPGTDANGVMISSMVAQSFAFFAVMLLVPQQVSWLMVRTRALAYEVMLPMDRRTYVRQLIAALAASYFQLCGVILASILLWWRLRVETPPPLGYVASLAAAACLVYICQFGIVVFAYTLTSLYTGTRLRIVQMAVVAVLLFGSVFLIGDGARTGNLQLPPEVLPIAAGLAALGVLLTYIAYRRWLAADFD